MAEKPPAIPDTLNGIITIKDGKVSFVSEIYHQLYLYKPGISALHKKKKKKSSIRL